MSLPPRKKSEIDNLRQRVSELNQAQIKAERYAEDNQELDQKCLDLSQEVTELSQNLNKLSTKLMQAEEDNKNLEDKLRGQSYDLQQVQSECESRVESRVNLMALNPNSLE